MTPHMIIAVVVFLVTYVAILSEKAHKTVAAMLGGSLMIVLGVVSQEEAYAAIDLSVLFLLTGMMVLVHFLAESGFFGYVAIRLAQLAKGRPIPLIILLCLVTGFLSALVDNVTTVLLIAPVTFLITSQLEVSPLPYLLFEAMASNVGGTATLIGDPPNILIGSAAGLSFNAFLFNLGPVTLVCLLGLVAAAAFFVRKEARVPRDARAKVMEMDANRAITNPALLIKTAAVILPVFAGFLLHDTLGLEPATIALTGAAVLLLITRAEPAEAFKAVEWTTLFFFVGLFTLVDGLRAPGLLAKVAQGMLSLTNHNLLATSMVLLWFSALAGAVIGAVPLVTTLIPVVHHLIPEIATHGSLDPGIVHQALWWSLALGACLGGNGTLVGTAANVVVVDIARKNHYQISFMRFMAYGMPVMLASLIISTLYILFRYAT